MTKDNARLILRKLQAVYKIYYQNISKEDGLMLIDVYSKVFADKSMEEVDRAVDAHIAKSKYAPTPADINEQIAENRQAIKAKEREEALERDGYYLHR